jgi:DNA polymerase I-like protein with 3'-5' exonuclease and polymerase domains
MTILKNYYGIAEQDLEDKAVEIRNLVLERYPGVKDWMDRERRLAREEELETRTLIGRRRVLKKYYSDYIDDWAVSPQERYASPIQGTAADIYKLALARLHQIIKDGDSKIILAVHDQITLECQRRQADEHKEILEKVLRDATAEILRDDAYARGKVADVEIKTNWSKT